MSSMPITGVKLPTLRQHLEDFERYLRLAPNATRRVNNAVEKIFVPNAIII